MTEIRKNDEIRDKRVKKSTTTQKENKVQKNNTDVKTKTVSLEANKSVTETFNQLDNVVSRSTQTYMQEINGVRFSNTNQTNQLGIGNGGSQELGGPNVPAIPERVSNVIDVENFLNKVQVPESIQQLGEDEVNKYKIYALANELHGQIYQDTEADKQNNLESYLKLKLDPANNNPNDLNSSTNGQYRDNPPFDDVDAEQTLMIASAMLAYDQVKKSGLVEGTDDFNKSWKNKFVDYQTGGINNFECPIKFGDYGWNEGYQDGTEGQTNHFWAGAAMTYNAFNDISNTWNPVYWLAIRTPGGKRVAIGKALEKAYEHELEDKPKGVGNGSSKEDMLNSALAVKLGFVLWDDKNFSPYDFANCWAAMTRSDHTASLEDSSFMPKQKWLDNLYEAPDRVYPPPLE